MKSLIVWIVAERSSACGGSDSLRNVWRGWKKASARDGPGLFPPEVVVQAKALACELPSGRQQPLSRWSVAEIAAQARRSGLVATISDMTARYGAGLTRMPSGPGIPSPAYAALPRDPDLPGLEVGRILHFIIGIPGRASR